MVDRATNWKWNVEIRQRNSNVVRPSSPRVASKLNSCRRFKCFVVGIESVSCAGISFLAHANNTHFRSATQGIHAACECFATLVRRSMKHTRKWVEPKYLKMGKSQSMESAESEQTWNYFLLIRKLTKRHRKFPKSIEYFHFYFFSRSLVKQLYFFHLRFGTSSSVYITLVCYSLYSVRFFFTLPQFTWSSLTQSAFDASLKTFCSVVFFIAQNIFQFAAHHMFAGKKKLKIEKFVRIFDVPRTQLNIRHTILCIFFFRSFFWPLFSVTYCIRYTLRHAYIDRMYRWSVCCFCCCIFISANNMNRLS